MAQKERTSAASKPPPANFLANDFAQAGQKQLEAIIEMQKVIINAFEKMNRDWLARNSEPAKPATANRLRAQSVESLQKPAAAVVDLQNEVLHSFETINREWAARIKAEMDLATEFADALTGARSIPDAAAACQLWMGKRIEMIFEDGRRLAAENQKVITATARYLGDGWTGGST
jgi:Phasin protein